MYVIAVAVVYVNVFAVGVNVFAVVVDFVKLLSLLLSFCAALFVVLLSFVAALLSLLPSLFAACCCQLLTPDLHFLEVTGYTFFLGKARTRI